MIENGFGTIGFIAVVLSVASSSASSQANLNMLLFQKEVVDSKNGLIRQVLREANGSYSVMELEGE